MDTESTIKDLLNGNLEVKDAIGKISSRDLGNLLYSYTKSLVSFAESKVVILLKIANNKSDKEDVFANIYYRMYLWMRSLVALNDPKDIQAVSAAARSLFELFLDLKQLTKDENGKDLEKYQSFREIEIYNEAKKIVDFYEKHYPEQERNYFYQKQFVSNPERKARIEQIAKTIWGVEDKKKITDIFNWSKKGIRTRAEAIGIEYERKYVDLYSRLCSIVHGSGSQFFKVLNFSQYESFYCLCQKSSQEIFVEATKIVASEMKIDLAWERNGFFKMLSELNSENLWNFLIYKLESNQRELGEEEKVVQN